MIGLIELEEEANETINAWERDGMRKNNNKPDPEGIIEKEILCSGTEKMKGEDCKTNKATYTQITKEQDDRGSYRQALRRRRKSDGKDIRWYVEKREQDFGQFSRIWHL